MGSVVKGIFGGPSAASGAGAAQAAASQAAVEEQRRQFDITQEQLAPFREAGVQALGRQQELLGLLGEERQQQALDAFQESPGQQFLRERQERTLLRNQAAIGGLGGGNIRRALQEQAAGIASTQLGDFQNRLAGLAGGGQTATTTLGQLGQQTASNIGSALQAAGQARASGILGAQEARSGLAGQIVGLGSMLFSDRRLKKNIVKIGELENGLNWYRFDWTEEAKDLVVTQDNEGVIAQEVQELLPHAVTEENGYLKVDYKELR